MSSFVALTHFAVLVVLPVGAGAAATAAAAAGYEIGETIMFYSRSSVAD